MFIPTTKEELKKLGWKQLDVIIVTGDTYIDSPFIGAAVMGHVLIDAGYRVGIIAQPDIYSEADITRLGEPGLFWGVTAGSLDSMVANYTALKKRRKSDDLTPGEMNEKRPDRATIVYSNLIRKYFKNTAPIVLGGIEASMRRIAHYDFWDNAVRKSILFDAKADILAYGMAEGAILEIAGKLKNHEAVTGVRGTCYISKEPSAGYIELPSYDEVKDDKPKFTQMFNIFYRNNDPVTAKGLCQKQDTRYLIHNPPADYPSKEKLDSYHNIDYEYDVHPYYKKMGKVRALDTIATSLMTHRGCYGECSFCSITIHQGRMVQSRSQESILREAKKISSRKDFRGYIADVGGPTANMYEIECENKLKNGACASKNCLYPSICKNLKLSHKSQTELLKKLRQIPGLKKAFIGSGIRYDMIMEDKSCGQEYLSELVNHHVSGQLRVAPEHTEEKILKLMKKPGKEYLKRFREEFNALNKKAGKNQFLTYYFICAHPGCTEKDMTNLKSFARTELKMTPEDSQVYTPLPSTYSALMYYTELNPFTGEKLFVEKNPYHKELQKQILGSYKKIPSHP